MIGRFMHSADGMSYTRQAYGQPHEHIVSVGREMMLRKMLEAVDQLPNVELLFDLKTVAVDFTKNQLTAEYVAGERTGEQVHFEADLIVGADGAYSRVRTCMTTRRGYNFSQEYLGHGYKELTIPPTADGE
jgi:kynurenine 3-monooxygenase